MPTAPGAEVRKGRCHKAEEETERRGYDEFRIYTNLLMVENIALYQHLGFWEIGRIQEQGFDRVYMAKPVA